MFHKCRSLNRRLNTVSAVLSFVVLCFQICNGWVSQTKPPLMFHCRSLSSKVFVSKRRVAVWSSNNGNDSAERTTFDQAGASLKDEEDQKRLADMGDNDVNPLYQSEKMDKLRERIQARTADLGIEKSQETADYIKARAEAAAEAGVPPAQMGGGEVFGGLDLSKISYDATESKGTWQEGDPSMLYDAKADLSTEDQEEADPVMKLPPTEQAFVEVTNSTFPGWVTAFQEVAFIILTAAISCVVIVNWDQFLRDFYKSLGFVPTAEDLQNYASRFDSLDLPEGWANNVPTQDLMNTVREGLGSASTMPDLTDSPSQFQ